jgi:UDP-N-acetylglucosamine--N-acetylmuramyl-(pentapeptide) pyrophosphoryl-undecaprenol N-acetylglucosamine transferase
MAEHEFTPETLASWVTALSTEPERLSRAAAVALAQGRPNAARDLADLVVRLAGSANGDSAPAERKHAA